MVFSYKGFGWINSKYDETNFENLFLNILKAFVPFKNTVIAKRIEIANVLIYLLAPGACLPPAVWALS
jgi:hypothetical protein